MELFLVIQLHSRVAERAVVDEPVQVLLDQDYRVYGFRERDQSSKPAATEVGIGRLDVLVCLLADPVAQMRVEIEQTPGQLGFRHSREGRGARVGANVANDGVNQLIRVSLDEANQVSGQHKAPPHPALYQSTDASQHTGVFEPPNYCIQHGEPQYANADRPMGWRRHHFLLEHGADIDTNWNSHAPASILHHLVFLDDSYDRMQFLIDRGIDMTIKDYRWNSTARGWAMYGKNDPKMAQWLDDAARNRRAQAR